MNKLKKELEESDFNRAYKEINARLKKKKIVSCSWCEGKGYSGNKSHPCFSCGGTGKLLKEEK